MDPFDVFFFIVEGSDERSKVPCTMKKSGTGCALIQTLVSLLCMQIGYQIVGTALEGMGGSALCGARVSMSLCRLDTYGWRVSEKHHLLFCALVVMCVRLSMATILYRTVQDPGPRSAVR